MDFRYKPAIRIISLIVLFFFCWTFGGVFDIAYAIKNSEQPSATSNQQNSQKSSGSNQKSKTQKSEEKFQKTIEDIEKTLTDTTTDTDTKKNKIKTKKTEIESLDVEIKKQFDATEKLLKEKGLPPEILERHHKFVRHYEDNLKELKTNLDDVEKSKTKSEADASIGRAKAHLEKVKPPKKHIPLDPNKLPHRTVEPVFKEPRTKPEEFQKDSSQYTVDIRQEKTNRKKPILVASIGSLNGLLSQTSIFNKSPLPLVEEGKGEGVLLALADPPTTADLAETIEVQFTPAIRAKAQELGYSPVKIYEFVRNNFEYEPYYGSLKGAQQTLLEKAGNDFDQASLLIALLRASNIPARYVYGTVEIPIEKLMNWVGGTTDPNTAATILATAGVPGKLLTEGGKIKYAQMEKCWVEAYVPYGNYRGSMRDESIKTWIPLDPSFKQLSPKTALDFYTALNFNGESFLLEQINNVSELIPYQVYSQKLKTYLEANVPNYNLEEVLGDVDGFVPSTNIIPKQYPYLLGSLPYKVITKGTTFSSIPDNLRHKITIQLSSIFLEEIEFSYTLPASEWINHRVTISYEPATQNDEALVNRYGNLLKVPPYLIQVKAVLKIDGVKAASGNPIGLGYDQLLNISFVAPLQKSDLVSNIITSGTYAAITIIPSCKVRADFSGGRMEQFWTNLYKVPSATVTLDDVLGEMLYNIGLTYFGQLSFQESLYASTFNMLVFRQPSEAITASNVSVEYLFDVPFLIEEGGISIDVDRNLYIPVSKTGDTKRAKDFMIISGITSSLRESKILEWFYDVPSVSAIKLLQLSSSQNIPIHTIDKTNINQILPLLQVSQTVKSEIQNTVNAGKQVIVPQSNIQYLDWYGTGYIILDPVTGVGAYMISNELSGGYSGAKLPTSARDIDALYKKLCPSLRKKILDYAEEYIDTPYRSGGKTPEGGFDCSGLAYYVYMRAGINIVKGRAQDQYNNSKKTTYPLLGDLVFYSESTDKAIYHVGIITAKDVMTDAPKPGDFVQSRPFLDAKKFFGTYTTKSCP